MSEPKVARGCARSGACCENVLLGFSPRQLRESYRAWASNDKSGKDIVRLDGIFLIWPMLEGRCRGKTSASGWVRYVYGPCKHLGWKVEGAEGKPVVRMAVCTIWEDRPWLCKGYPSYEGASEVQMGEKPPATNPGYMKGCGYNADPKVESAPEEFGPGKLEPLSGAEE